MRYRLAIEDMKPNHWIAWVLDLPGCFSSGRTADEAIARAPERINTYYRWLGSHHRTLQAPVEAPELDIIETFHSYRAGGNTDYQVNALFTDDRRPLNYWEVVVALRLLTWTRLDLWNVLRPLTPEQLERPLPGEFKGSIGGLVEHIASTENWYFGHLGLGLKPQQLPENPLTRLVTVRAHTRRQIPWMIGRRRTAEVSGETWSTRKIIRRTLWHERDHTAHIAKLLKG